MAVKVVFLALLLSILKVRSQSIGCSSNLQSSKGQSSCGCGQSQLQTIPFQTSNNNALKASPQLQIVPNQNCNLQTIPLSQLFSQLQGSNLKKNQECNIPKQNIQMTSLSQIPSQKGQCAQLCDNCNPSVITAPVSTITIPPSTCTTIIDNSLSNCLANALQMRLAADLIDTAISKNIVNQDCISIPVGEKCLPNFDLNSFVTNLNANQIQGYQCGPTAVNCYCKPDDDIDCDWKKLLEKAQDYKCDCKKDWSTVLEYLDSKNKEDECESEYDYNSFLDSIKQKGQTIYQISKQYPQECNVQKGYPSQCDDSFLIEALTAYLGNSGNCGTSYGNSGNCGTCYGNSGNCGTCYGNSGNCGTYLGNSGNCGTCYGNYGNCNCGNVAEVVFPDEIPAQLICDYGYMPTTVPVVSFSVKPVGDPNCNYIVGSQSC